MEMDKKFFWTKSEYVYTSSSNDEKSIVSFNILAIEHGQTITA